MSDGPITRARMGVRALEVLRRCDAEQAVPSIEEREVLAAWPGWGPLAPALEAAPRGSWARIGDDIAALVSRRALAAGRQATYSAFYTPPWLASACWGFLRQLRFPGGKILEPGCGAGVFMATTPTEIKADWVGVERDPLTARIAELLHPQATIQATALQDAWLPDRSVDAVLGNVPFADVGVYAPTAPDAVTKSLHNYCLWRSIQALRPGGIAILITSRYTLDAEDPAAREAIDADADLVTSLRLPNEAFAPAGVDICPDILVFRRRLVARPDGARRPSWLDTVRPRELGSQPINQWVFNVPRTVLGRLRLDRGPNGAPTFRVDPRSDTGPTPEAVPRVFALTAANDGGGRWSVAPSPQPLSETLQPRTDGRKEGSFQLLGGEHVFQVLDGELDRVERAGPELNALIRLRDAALALLEAEADHALSEQELAPRRETLNRLYDKYTKRFGALNRCTIVQGPADPETGLPTLSRRRPRMGGFRADPDYATVLALEDYDEATGEATKAPILSRRVNHPAQRRTHADTTAEAIGLCLDQLGCLDLPTIAELLDITPEQVPALLERDDVAYIDPATSQWVSTDEYLSGNVRTKLAKARDAAQRGPEAWARNVAALERVLPADLVPEDIHARLGAPWIPASDVQEFIAVTLGDPYVEVKYHPVNSVWEIETSKHRRNSVAATSEWGTKKADAFLLIEQALNGKAPVVWDLKFMPDGGERRVRNPEETMLAEEKQRALSMRFGEWVWEEPERADRLCAVYNERFNSVVPRRYDGAHLTFPGLAPDFQPYAHQFDMVHRMISTPTALCPYPVGTGKTGTMFLAARKLKELGLVSKPLIVVPNHLLEQVTREGKRMFPTANVLMTTKQDLADATARKRFAARCATADWDAVVMTHSAFTALPVHPRTHAEYMDEMCAKFTLALQASGDDGGRPSRTVKRIAKQIDAWREQSKERLEHATDDGIYFEHLGVDYLMVDEAHYFKNLGLPIHTDGFSVPASKRATDLDLKLSMLRGARERVGTLFTGTPVSNSLLEMYVLQHYLQPERLAETGLDNADAWAATFVEFTTSVEVAPDGGSFRLYRRPSKFQNVPELLTLFGEFAELRPADAFQIKRPDAVWETRVIDGGRDLRAYVATLADRADAIRKGAIEPQDDNMLKVCNDGRKAALDLSLVDPETDGAAKIDEVVATVSDIYHATADQPLTGDPDDAQRGRLQIIFCDLATPNRERGSQVYGKIRSGLIEAGLPAETIRFIHQAGNDAGKAALFADCRAGRVAVLLGSTDKLGVGTNIQQRAIALHHVDAPWRPADVEQREGRVLRPGNRNPAAAIFRYVTEGSFDSYMWQTLERKARFIRQLMSGTPGQRQVDDIGAATLDYGQVKALATGNPMLLELAELDTEIARLKNLATAHTRNAKRLEHDMRGWREQIATKTRLAADYDALAATVAGSPDTTWYNASGNRIGKDDVPDHLAGLAETADQGLLAGAGATWRGLSVTFARERFGMERVLLAYIRTGHHGVDVTVPATWMKKGQHWRLHDAITKHVNEAASKAEELRTDADGLKERVTAATEQAGKPFEHAAELNELRARRDQINAAIHQAASEHGKDKNESAEPVRPAAEGHARTLPPPTVEEAREFQGLPLAKALGLPGRTATIHTHTGTTRADVQVTSLIGAAEDPPALIITTPDGQQHVPLTDIHHVDIHATAEPTAPETRTADRPVPEPSTEPAKVGDVESSDTRTIGQPEPPPASPDSDTPVEQPAPEPEQAPPVRLAAQDTPPQTHTVEHGLPPSPRRHRRPNRRRAVEPGPGQGALFDLPAAPVESDRPSRSR